MYIEKTASSLLKRYDLLEYPIDLKSLLKKENIELHTDILEPEISGMLIIQNGKTHILVNDTHHKNRQNFTIAHELGHLHLHHTGNKDSLFVDTQYMIYRRAGVATNEIYQSGSSTTTPKQEREANKFASALLMPEELIQKYLRKNKIEFLDETKIVEFARAFNVSEQAATIRLMNFEF